MSRLIFLAKKILKKTLNEKKNQSISLDKIRALFKNLEQGDGAEFFTQVADDVDWIVESHG